MKRNLGKKPTTKLSKSVESPRPTKKAKSGEGPSKDDHLSWRFSSCDRNGPWPWPNLSDPEKYRRVIEKLSGLEQMNQEQIKNTGSHPIAVDALVKDARDRLQQLHKDDVDELYSFRISGRERVWCIRKQNVMEVLWWDPNHEVCPSTPK